MPRSARLDVPNVLQHVMARGIEGREIFRDKRDREEFLRRLSEVMIKGKGQLFAWSLISNHFHLLLRPRGMPLATMMRRLLTGYAVWHNRRHARKGHLFQNRYKSIVVEEDPYFLELVRYIHLNPVRARMLGHLSELDRFPYTGHAVIIGHRAYGCQDVDAVLRWFGKRVGEARRGYRSLLRRGSTRGGGRIFVVVASFEVPGVESIWCDGQQVSGNWGTSGFWEVERLWREFSKVKLGR